MMAMVPMVPMVSMVTMRAWLEWWRVRRVHAKGHKDDAPLGAEYFTDEHDRGMAPAPGWFTRVQRDMTQRGINRRLRCLQFISRFYSGDFSLEAVPGPGWAVEYPKDRLSTRRTHYGRRARSMWPV